MSRIALKIDVDTYRGTREGVPRLAALLERLDVRATFLFSLGPDHTGRAIRRVFRRGFVGKVQRTSVWQHYGLKTLLYGTVLPGPHIGQQCASLMREIARQGFEVGVHSFDHVKWQDGVAAAEESWTHAELQRARAQFIDIFQRPPNVHGAAGWQVNRHVPRLEQQLGFQYASDVRGRCPFVPVVDGIELPVPQLPTTLPTLDELIGRADLNGIDPIAHLFELTNATPGDHVFTLHAEIEGGAYLQPFELLLRRWRGEGVEFTDLATHFMRLDIARLPRCEIVAGQLPGRSGTLACQA